MAVTSSTDIAKRVLHEDSKVLYGIFGLIAVSPWFPPHGFLNEFFMGGNDPCDQDGRMHKWRPFSLNQIEYEEVKAWWLELHPGAVVSDLAVSSWRDWEVKLIHGDDA
jgi:hypothetical protein